MNSVQSDMDGPLVKAHYNLFTFLVCLIRSGAIFTICTQIEDINILCCDAASPKG